MPDRAANVAPLLFDPRYRLPRAVETNNTETTSSEHKAGNACSRNKMEEIDHPPDAPSLLESMRSIGYSLESALADIVDNSISARARNVSVEFRPEPVPYLAISDDGEGMSAAELERAMRHGSTDPRSTRSEHDLGRYGLGLKTASLSQCRRLTVVSLKDGQLSGYSWDLDRILERKAWTLLKLGEDDITALPHVPELLQQESGTIVFWHDLDRLMAGESSIEKALGQQMAAANEHLSLVFHRYISGEPGLRSLMISFNRRPLDAVDPFLADHRATQRLAEDSFTVERHRVQVKPFILPHLSKLTPAEIGRAGGGDGLRHQQGFYVYRNRRLIIWGTWFRLARKDELSKLARVRVDIPNGLDHLWTIDVKKSAAVPPEAVRTNLRRTIERIRQVSGRTLVYRGRQANLPLVTPGWIEMLDREGVRFDINRKHPVVEALRGNLEPGQQRQLESVLRVMEQSFPAEALYARLATDHRPRPAAGDGLEQDFRATLTAILEGWSTGEATRKAFLGGLHLIEPFSSNPAVAQKIAREYQ
jgi:hypothetical protein